MHSRLSQLLAAIAVAAALVGAGPGLAQQRPPERINGKPNLNGMWQALNNAAHWNLEAHAASQLTNFWQLGAIGAIPAGQSVVKEGKIPYLPDALAKRDENRAGWPKSDPEAACYLPGIPRATYMPHPFQIIQGDGDILFAYAFANANRAVHMTDIRTLDEVPVDLWMGWSNGKWEGDTLVVEVLANDDRTWLDRSGNYHSNAMKVTERYTLLEPESDSVRSDDRRFAGFFATLDDLVDPVSAHGAERGAFGVQVRRVLRTAALRRVPEGTAEVGTRVQSGFTIDSVAERRDECEASISAS